MKKRKILSVAAVTVLILNLCGCNLFTVDTEQLLNPPRLSGSMQPISKALDESIKENYILKYPSSGDRHSAVILEDIDGDSTFEAFAFYSTEDDNGTVMNVNLICENNGKWHSAATASISAGGVDSVDFCDFDNDGISEILVGWEIYGSSEKQLAVYSFENNKLIQKMLEQYTQYAYCDLDENGQYELFIQKLSAADAVNQGIIYSYDKKEITRLSECVMDSSVNTTSKPIVSQLSSGKPALYIDEIKGIGAVTEVLFLSKGELVNSLLDKENSFENSITLRSSSLPCKDINDDGILEIPVAVEIPCDDLEKDENVFYTHWCSYNGEQLTVKLVTLVNIADGYYITVPQKWIGKISISRDLDKKIRRINEYNPKTAESGECLAEFIAVSQSDYDENIYKNSGYTEITRLNGNVYVGAVKSKKSLIAINNDELVSMLVLYEK